MISIAQTASDLNSALTSTVKITTNPQHHQAAFTGRIRCDDDEHAKLTANAATAGLSVGAFLRAAGLGSAGLRARRRPPLEREAVAQLLGQIGCVGGNVNQMAREMNRTGNFASRAELARAADDIAAIRAELMQALGRETTKERAAEVLLPPPGVRLS